MPTRYSALASSVLVSLPLLLLAGSGSAQDNTWQRSYPRDDAYRPDAAAPSSGDPALPPAGRSSQYPGGRPDDSYRAPRTNDAYSPPPAPQGYSQAPALTASPTPRRPRRATGSPIPLPPRRRPTASRIRRHASPMASL